MQPGNSMQCWVDAAGQLNSMLYSIFRNHMATDMCGEIGLQRI